MTDTLNTENDLAFFYPQWITRLGNTDDDDIDPQGEEDKDKGINALEIGLSATAVHRSAGGQTLDHVDLEWALKGHLINRDTPPTNFAQSAELFFDDDTDPKKRTRLHWGEYVTESEQVSPQGESLTGQSHIRPYHFGVPFEGQMWVDVTTSQEKVVGFGPTFNPRIDDVVLGNKSDATFQNTSNDVCNIWGHPEAARTDAAELATRQELSLWDLREAVKTMCIVCNPAGEFVQNPSIADGGYDIFNGAPAIDSIVLPIGQYLPHYLDALLHPLGYNWFVDYNNRGNNQADALKLPTITFFKRNQGTARSVKLQMPGESLDLSKTNCSQYAIARRIGDAPNEIKVEGALQRREVTLPLWPSWSETEDSQTAADLEKGAANYLNREHVHRKWIVNESGDYTGIRTDDLSAVMPDLTSVFNAYIPHRRNAFEPYSYLADGSTGAGNKHQPQPINVEYSLKGGEMDPASGDWFTSTGGGDDFRPLRDIMSQNFTLLPDELGIYFNADTPPAPLIDAMQADTPPLLRLRITCVVEGDSRVEGLAVHNPSQSANSRRNRLTISVPQKFVDAQVHSSGPYRSDFSVADPGQNPRGANEQDDTNAIQEYAELLLSQYEGSENACEFTLPGHHGDYQIGDLITEIEGRNVTLNEAAGDGAPRYPQITAITMTMGEAGPMTMLRCDRGVRPQAFNMRGIPGDAMMNEKFKHGIARGGDPRIASTPEMMQRRVDRELQLDDIRAGRPPRVLGPGRGFGGGFF